MLFSEGPNYSKESSGYVSKHPDFTFIEFLVNWNPIEDYFVCSETVNILQFTTVARTFQK